MLQQFFKYLLKQPALGLFLLLCGLAALILWARIQWVENETIAFQIMQEQGRFGFFKLLNGLKYFAVPLGYAFKLTIVAFILWTGAFMFGYKISFAQMWKVALVGEYVFLVAEFLKLVWLMVSPTDLTLLDIQAFYPLSLMNVFDIYIIPQNWVYPLQSLNIFEPLNWLVLVYGIHFTAQKKLNYAYAIVFTTYVPAFLSWLVYYSIVYH